MSANTSRRVQAQHSRRRPFVLWVLIILHIVQAASGLLILGFISLINVNSPLISEAGLDALQEYGKVPVLLFASTSLLFIHLVLAYGLWRLQRWAWIMTMITLAFSMTLDILAFLDGTPTYFPMLINVLLVFYLNQAEIQELFATPQTLSKAHPAHE